jgi:predicted DNA-binding WGR domain protein
MNLFPTEAYLTRVRPELNMQRFYTLSIVPDLFGGCSLVRRWGRIGSSGSSKRIEYYEHEGKAVDALMDWIKAKTKRGYQVMS